MAKARHATCGEGGEYVNFVCPGCGDLHTVRVKHPTASCWGWNGSLDAPTFTPSVLVTYGPFGEHSKIPGQKLTCHSFVTDGKIQFLTDSSHHLAGQTVELPDISPDGFRPEGPSIWDRVYDR